MFSMLLLLILNRTVQKQELVTQGLPISIIRYQIREPWAAGEIRQGFQGECVY